MPLYEFLCLHCGHNFYLIQKMDEAAPKCPECGSRTKRQISSGSFRLNGDGFYKGGFSGGKK